MSSACGNHRRPPLASDADRRALHELGYLELPKVPEWELLAFCEKCATVGLNPDKQGQGHRARAQAGTLRQRTLR